ncbi:hypothetical protein MMC19_000787 [Ptychographa xylographoides]|nr:hypothetical protein [Ptychographa xylographoides]
MSEPQGTANHNSTGADRILDYEVYEAYGGWPNFMRSHGLKVDHPADVQEGLRLTRVLKQDLYEAKAEEQDLIRQRAVHPRTQQPTPQTDPLEQMVRRSIQQATQQPRRRPDPMGYEAIDTWRLVQQQEQVLRRREDALENAARQQEALRQARRLPPVADMIQLVEKGYVLSPPLLPQPPQQPAHPVSQNHQAALQYPPYPSPR